MIGPSESHTQYEMALLQLKKKEFSDDTLQALDDVDAMIIRAWRRVKKTEIKKPRSNRILDEAWGFIEFDAQEWARAANIDESTIWSRWIKLAENRAIFPDGTCPDAVNKFVTSRMRSI